MNSLDGILKLADNELMSIAEKGQFRSRDDVDNVYKLIDIVKDIHCIWEYEDEGYSNDGGSYRGGRSNRGNYRGSYEGGRSRMAYRGGYSRAEYIDEMRRMMDSAPDEQTRQGIQRMIQNMQ